jgi:hypothetical protein
LADVLRSARAIRERQSSAGKGLPDEAVRLLTEMHQKHGEKNA